MLVYLCICANILKVSSLKRVRRVGAHTYFQIKSTARFTPKKLMSRTLYSVESQITKDLCGSRTPSDPVKIVVIVMVNLYHRLDCAGCEALHLSNLADATQEIKEDRE